MSDINSSTSSVKVNGTAKGDYIYNTAHHVTVTAGKGNDTVEFASGSSRSVYKYANGDGNDTIIGFDNFTEGIIQLTSGSISNYQINSSTGDHVIKVGKGSITLKDVKTDKVAIKTKSKSYRYINGKAFNDPSYNGWNFYSDDPVEGTSGNDYINVGGDKVTINAGAGNDYINIDITYANKNFLIDAESGDDTIKTIGSYATLIGGYGDDVIYANGTTSVIEYFKGDGDDVVYGYDSSDTLQIMNSEFTTTASGQDVIVNVDDGKITLKNAAGNTLNIKSRSATLAELKTVKLTNKNKSSFVAPSQVGIIDASKRTATSKLTGNFNNNSIVGGTKNDTLNGGGGNDTLTGGKGKDLFMYTSGDDVIVDYTAGQDKIKLVGAVIQSASVTSSNVALTTDSGTLTINSAASKKISITNANKKTFTYIFGSSSINGSKGKEIINGSEGVDTIKAGKGNDTIYGGGGDDVFFYTTGDGNDVIADFTDGDVIKLGSSKTKVNANKSKVSGNDYLLKIGSGTIKIKNAASKEITVLDSVGVKQVYNSQKSYIELFDDDNYSNSDSCSELNEIIDSQTKLISNEHNGSNSNEKIFTHNVDDALLFNKSDLSNTTGQSNNVNSDR